MRWLGYNNAQFWEWMMNEMQKKKKSHSTARHKKENVHNEDWNTFAGADFYNFF